MPSSSSHALFGGLIGATIAALGLSGVKPPSDSAVSNGTGSSARSCCRRSSRLW
ncbi:MAG TPA: hypothetical protein VF241_10380 [Propionibacteriaceae bacterium]